MHNLLSIDKFEEGEDHQLMYLLSSVGKAQTWFEVPSLEIGDGNVSKMQNVCHVKTVYKN